MLGLKIYVWTLFTLAVLAVPKASAQGTDVVGSIRSSRAAAVSARPTSGGAYANVSANQPVHNGDGVRTARRGFAQIQFKDQSVLRLNELTELIVQDSVALRRIQLAKGALWVRVTKGSNTSVQTPVATATVRGTEFLMDELGNLAVRDGVVTLEANGFSIDVLAGETAGIGPDGKPFKRGTPISTNVEPDPVEFGIPDVWWKILKGGDVSNPNSPGRDRTKDLLVATAVALPLFLVMNNGSSNHNNSSAVPEPATIAVIVIGIGALAARRRK